MDYETLRYSLDDGVARIVLTRPDRLNALSEQLLDELASALDQVVADQAGALLLTGAGRAFCAGADLVELDDVPLAQRDMGAGLETRLNPLLIRLRDLPLPVVAAVNGLAAGGGLGLALAADIVIAARSAYFLCPFARIGLVPDVGATWFLPRMVGRARATGMMLLGERIAADRAEQWGLIWQAVDDDQLLTTANAIAAQLAQGPRVALARTRLAIHAALESDLSGALDRERADQRDCGRTADSEEGIAAFREKREPAFRSGR